MTKKSKPPTEAQLNVIADFEYTGPAPTTSGEASLIVRKCLEGDIPRKQNISKTTLTSQPSDSGRQNDGKCVQHEIEPDVAKYINAYVAHTSSPRTIESNTQLLWRFWCNLPVERRYTKEGWYIHGAFFEICPDFPSFIAEFIKFLQDNHSYVTDNKAAVLNPQSTQFRQFLNKRFTSAGFPKPLVYYLDEWLEAGMPASEPKMQEVVNDSPMPEYPRLRSYYESSEFLQQRCFSFRSFESEYIDEFLLYYHGDPPKDVDDPEHPAFLQFLEELTESIY